MDSSADLDEKGELRHLLSMTDALQRKLKFVQKFSLYDPLSQKVNPVFMERSKLDDLLKRRMMQ